MFTERLVPCETLRRRAVGDLPVLLVDVPFVHLGYFRKASPGRLNLENIPLLDGATVVRPILEGAMAAADAWIASAADDLEGPPGSVSGAAPDET